MKNETFDFSKALAYLKAGMVVSDVPDSYFVYKNERIVRYCKGSRYRMSEEDFTALFMTTTFFIPEDDLLIDELKDREYYAYKHK